MIDHGPHDERPRYLDMQDADEEDPMPVPGEGRVVRVPMSWRERFWIAVIALGFLIIGLAVLLGMWDELKFVGRLFR